MIKAEDNPSGKKAVQVAKMLEVLSDADEPMPFEDICSAAEVKYPQDVAAAFYALELVGAVDRYTFVKKGTTRKQVAYALADDVEVK